MQPDQSIRTRSDRARRTRQHKKWGDEKTSVSVTWGLTIISFISLMLTLLGYGVAMAVETTFGVPHQVVYSSVLDLMGLSVYALISLILGIGEIRWLSIFKQLWQPILFMAACMFCFASCVIYLRIHQGQSLAHINCLWHYFRPTIEYDSIGKSLIKGVMGSSLFGGFILTLPFLFIGALLFILLLISTVPILGSQLGAQYFWKFVITPSTCEPIRSKAALEQVLSTPRKKTAAAVSTANCVALLKDASQVAIGRVVVSTPAAIVLFEPDSGSIWRVPIGDLTVQPVDSIAAINKQ